MPVPAAVPSWYFRVELISTIPGSTLLATACSLIVVVLLPPDPPVGEGICCDEMPEFAADVEPWLSASTVPAPIPAASAATTTYTSVRAPRRRGGWCPYPN